MIDTPIDRTKKTFEEELRSKLKKRETKRAWQANKDGTTYVPLTPEQFENEIHSQLEEARPKPTNPNHAPTPPKPVKSKEQQQRVKLTADVIEAFAGTFLSPLYDNPQPTPKFHRECWGMYCSDKELVAVAAPREHAKSMALTHTFILATILFRDQDYVVLVSATEELAIGHLSDIAKELRENEDIIAMFGIKKILTDAKTDIIVEFLDGHQARVIAKGSGQKMRGLKWNGARPGLIVCHAKGTKIFDRDIGEWIVVDDHPTAKEMESDLLRVVLLEDDNYNEVVSSEHYYLVRESINNEAIWMQARNIKPGYLIGEANGQQSESRLLPRNAGGTKGAIKEGTQKGCNCCLSTKEQGCSVCSPEEVGRRECGEGSSESIELGSEESRAIEREQEGALREEQRALQQEGCGVLERTQGREATSLCEEAESCCASHACVVRQEEDSRDLQTSEIFGNVCGSHCSNKLEGGIRTSCCRKSSNNSNVGKFKEAQFVSGVEGSSVTIDGFTWRVVASVEQAGKGMVVAIRTKSGFYKTKFGMSHNCDDL